MTPSSERRMNAKATLFCPDCGHESRINGDWTLRVLADSTTYECPECGTTIDSRRDPEVLSAESDGALQSAADD